MQSSNKTGDQILGCLLGGALGDAWGGPWEGRAGPSHFEVPSQSKVSDDTQLTLATCESIIERGCVDPESLASHFLEWFVKGRITGMGSGTLKAMRDLSAGVHWALAGRRGEYAAGSGAAMRIAPLAFLLDPSKAGDRTIIRDACRITHHNDEAYVGALAVVLAIRSVLAGIWSQQHSFLSEVVDSLPDSAVRDRIVEIIQLQLSPSKVSSHFSASGHVVAAVPLALHYAQYIAEEPLSVVLSRPISAGGDTDTIASLTGQLAGTVVRATGVPHELFSGVEGREEIFQIATRFAEFVSAWGK
ncbi:MAG TPA: ADP-ribosylglycohydrolase family protein [Candidatus Acidoferrum sp.]